MAGTNTARIETRVLSEMAALAATDLSYLDLVHRILDLVEHVVSAPFLSLIVDESLHIPSGHTSVPAGSRSPKTAGHYIRAAGVDPLWAREGRRHVESIHGRVAVGERAWTSHLATPPAHFASFPATTRTGRTSALTLGAPERLTIATGEEEMMLRLARQALLVLDHALILAQLESLELQDPLTGVANHRKLLEVLEYELRRNAYVRGCLALLVIDVDGLGTINRIYGTSYGNHVLRRIAQMLEERVRPIDLVARSGLDEFAVVMPATDDEEGQRTLERLREEIGLVESAGGTVEVTIGIAYASVDDRVSAEALLRRAERAMNEAKRQDRVLIPARRV